MKRHLFTSESVSAGHPDKVADQISDAILDEYLRHDPESRVACEVLCTRGLVVISGEVSSRARVDVEKVAREVIRDIGYNDAEIGFDCQSCGVVSTIHSQSPDIIRGVERKSPDEQGAGDQGIMFGYAVNESPDLMPLPLYLSHGLLQVLDAFRTADGSPMPYLRPDAKCQVTVEYEGRKPARIHTIVLSTQHTQFADDETMHGRITGNIKRFVLPAFIDSLDDKIRKLFDDRLVLLVNPTGKFVLGSPAADTGLTGRKIIVDTYGGRACHGGGAFSGKDPSKVDRSAAYAARYIAKNLVAAGIADEVQIQIGYAIGVAKPVSINVETFGTARHGLTNEDIAEKILELFDLRPGKIIEKFALKNPIYEVTAAYGHFGKPVFSSHKVFYDIDGEPYFHPVRYFLWEQTDAVRKIKEAFGI